jgi:hypothetical protein
MSEQPTPCVCVACDSFDDRLQYTPGGAGPFCGECWDALNDPDQALLIEKRLELGKRRIDELQSLLSRATNALEESLAADVGLVLPELIEFSP